jgi:hypothetical protein
MWSDRDGGEHGEARSLSGEWGAAMHDDVAGEISLKLKTGAAILPWK